MTDELVAAIDDAASAHGWTRTTWVLHACGIALHEDMTRMARRPRTLAAIRLQRLMLDSIEDSLREATGRRRPKKRRIKVAVS